jgi:hypothetical protein
VGIIHNELQPKGSASEETTLTPESCTIGHGREGYDRGLIPYKKRQPHCGLHPRRTHEVSGFNVGSPTTRGSDDLSFKDNSSADWLPITTGYTWLGQQAGTAINEADEVPDNRIWQSPLSQSHVTQNNKIWHSSPIQSQDERFGTATVLEAIEARHSRLNPYARGTVHRHHSGYKPPARASTQ